MTTSRLTPEARRVRIMDFARENGRILVEDIAQRLSASSETIRRDLNLLASSGALRKFHGGACLPSLTDENPFSTRMSEQTAGKRAIGRVAAELFVDGETMFIDTGTTTLFFAEELRRLQNLAVVTNSTSIAATLSGGSNSIYLLGGLYQGDAGETTGETTVEQIGNFRASHAVLTSGAVHALNGMMDFSPSEAQVARAMIEQADRLTVLADNSKIGRSAFARVCPLNAIDRLVTDIRPPEDMVEALAAAGVELVVASS